MKMNPKILQYRFEDKKSAIIATVIGNLIMGFIILFADLGNITKVPQIQYCLASGLIILLLYVRYHWKNIESNGLILGAIPLLGIFLAARKLDRANFEN